MALTEAQKQAERAYRSCRSCGRAPCDGIDRLFSCFRCQNEYCSDACYFKDHHPRVDADNDPICKAGVPLAPRFVKMKAQEYVESLTEVIGSYKPKSKPKNELEIENDLYDLLDGERLNVERQRTTGLGRYDLLVTAEIHRQQTFTVTKRLNIILELKYYANASVTTQLDRYSRDADALIVVCWHASKSLKNIFEMAKEKSKIPVELIEISAGLPFL